jgi:hypothetical protein
MRLICVLALLVSLPAVIQASDDDKAPDPQAISALQVKANAAQPREQCFLYAELVHKMIELAGSQMASGDQEHASTTLRDVQQYTQKIHLAVSEDNKRLKNAEILLRHAAFRLKGILHGTPLNDRPVVENTLAQLNQVQAEAMMQVFRK